MLRSLSIVVRLAWDLIRWCALFLQPRKSLEAEILFLRRQLALYRERGVKPRRVDAETRETLAFLSRWFDWRTALVVVRPETLLDATSHQELGRVRLKQRISWGRIQGDRLLLIQGASLSGGYEQTAPAHIYSLPTLQLLRSTTITGGNGEQSWGNYIASLGREIAVYDDQFERVYAVTFPSVRSKGNVSCAAKGSLLIAQDKAVVVANCGEIYVVNLKTRSLEVVIAAFSHFYSAQIIDGILLAGATDGEQSKDIHAFDLTSGELLAVLPIDASRGLSVIGPQVLAMSSRCEGYRDKVTITSSLSDLATDGR